MHSSSLPHPTMRPSTDPNYSLAYHSRNERMIYKRAYLQLVDTPTISRSLFRTERQIKRSSLETKKYENDGNKRKNYEKRFMHSKALKIHEFSFNATKIAQRRV